MDHVYIAVVNQNYAVNVPHQDIPGTDLCCIAKTYHDKSPFPHVVTTEDLQAERLTDEELFELAYPSVSPDHYCIRSIEQALGGAMDEEIASDLTADLPHGTIFVVSNKDGLDGASVLASPEAMQLIQARLGGSELIIIPSSVHEILVLRREDAPNVSELNQIIREVNQAEVSEKARLADHAFSFNGRLSIARDEALSQDQKCTQKKERILE